MAPQSHTVGALLVALAASVSACSPGGDPSHPASRAPQTSGEREAAARYRAFARALEREDGTAICRELSPALARRYRCGARVRVPEDLRGLEIPAAEIFVQEDGPPLLLSSRVRPSRKGQLFAYLSRGPDGRWRIDQALVGYAG